MIFYLIVTFLFILPFLNGGTNFLAEILILILPLPLFLIGLAKEEFDFNPTSPFGLRGARVFWAFGVFVFFAGVSVIFSQSKIMSIPAFFQMLAIFIWFGMFLMIKKNNNRPIITLLLVVSFLLSVVSFYYLLPGITRPLSGMNLVYATYGHNHLADILLMAIPIVLVYFLTSKDKKSLLGWGGLGLFYLISFILTFSRGALIILPIVVFVLLILIKPQKTLQKLLGWFMVLLPIALIVLIWFFSLSRIGQEARDVAPYQWLVKQVVKPDFESKRTAYWRQAIEGIKDKPVFGYGLGTFELISQRFQNEPNSWSNYAHNFYLQIWAETGVFGGLGLLGVLGVVVWEIRKNREKIKKDTFLMGCFGAVLASSLHSFIDFDWHFPAVLLLFLFILANLIKEKTGNNRDIFFTCKPGESKVVGCESGYGGKDGGRTKLYPITHSRPITQNSSPFGIFFLFLSLLVFLFGQLELASEYFDQRGDPQKALLLVPWPPVRVRSLAEKIFDKNFNDGEKAINSVMTLSLADSSMDKWLGEKYEKHGDLTKTVFYYDRAIKNNLFDNLQLITDLGGIYEQLNQNDKRDQLYDSFDQKISSVSAGDGNRAAAKTIYRIGYTYLIAGNLNKALFWWEKAPAWSPEWSYFYIELASLDLKMGQRQKAKEVLNSCLKFYFPKTHCQEYLNRLNKNQVFEEPGFYREKIDKEIYD